LLSACSDVHNDVEIFRLHLFSSTIEVMRSIKSECVFACEVYVWRIKGLKKVEDRFRLNFPLVSFCDNETDHTPDPECRL